MNRLKFQYLIAVLVTFILAGCGADSSDVANGQDGQSGSTSRFTIQQGYLVVVDSPYIQSFRIDSETGALYPLDQIGFNRELQTAHAYGTQQVLVGTTTGTLIMNVSSSGELALESFVDHARSCDPVVADGNTMYVTLSNSGTAGSCGGSEYDNHLLVYDITDIEQPVLRGTVALDQPTGLAIDGDNLWVCYAGGLKRFSREGNWSVTETGAFSDLSCNDIIIDGTASYLTNDDGVQLVDLQDSTPVVLAVIAEGS
ncbi:hypothetical protein [Oceanobacter mangrovi]|uniref:hypothetical protein n=1 Tax=Oceanobacter mangrovi TaxID=2862510 RepID=UPI001C8D1629|nr:hypothetical protein [Oceanobacter mangrovi]